MKSPREVGSSLAWNYTGRILDSAGMYVVGIIVARALNVREYGWYALVLSGMQMVLALSSVGMEASLNKFIPGLASEHRIPAIRHLIRSVTLVRAFLASIAAAVVAYLLNLSSHPGSTVSPILAFFVFALMRSVIPLLAMSMVSQLRPRIPATIAIVIRIVDVVVVAVLASIGGTVELFVLALACTSLVHVAALLVFIRPSMGGAAEAIAVRPILTFGAIFWINVGVDFILGRFGDVVLLGILGPDKNQTGLYEIGAGLVQAAGVVLTTGMGGINFALFAEIASRDEPGGTRMRDFYHAIVRISSALTLPLMVFLLVDGETVVRALYTERFLGALFVVRAYAAVRIAARIFGGGENTEALLAIGRVGLVSTIGAVSAVVNLAGDILLIPLFGAAGAVIATSTAYALVTSSTFVFVRKAIGVQLQPDPYFRLLAGTAVGALALFAVPTLEPRIAVIAHVILYTMVTLGSWTVFKPFHSTDIAFIERMHHPLGSRLRVFSAGGDR